MVWCMGWMILLTMLRIMFQVTVSTVKMLTDSQLNKLGVARIGERASLRRKCQEVENGKFWKRRNKFFAEIRLRVTFKRAAITHAADARHE